MLTVSALLPVVTENFLLHLGVEVAFGAGVLSVLAPAASLSCRLVFGLGFQQGTGSMGAVVVQQQQVHIGGGEGTLIAQVGDRSPGWWRGTANGC